MRRSRAGTTSLSYDYESRVTSITYPSLSTNTFIYNGLDTRVGKTDSSGTKTFRRDGAYVTDPVLSDGASTFTPGVSVRTGTTSRFQHADRLGSFVRQTNAGQGVASSRRWDAFGNVASQTGTHTGPFDFAGDWGYQSDADSGLQLLGHRYYDPLRTVGIGTCFAAATRSTRWVLMGFERWSPGWRLGRLGASGCSLGNVEGSRGGLEYESRASDAADHPLY